MTITLVLFFLISACNNYEQGGFDSQRAYQDIIAQVNYGSRTPGSPAHAMVISYITSELEAAGWSSVVEETSWQGFSVKNILASKSMGDSSRFILLGAHYDSRLKADQEPGTRNPVPGANDGASGVAILLELARSLPDDTIPILFAFFDAEDNGGLEGRDWIMGSREFAGSLEHMPQAVVIVDMVGDIDLNLYLEANSDQELSQEIWTLAADLGYGQFIPEIRFSILDDHIPFVDLGIPTVLIIDFDYPYWHKTGDTIDKISAASLEVVGNTLYQWILAQNR